MIEKAKRLYNEYLTQEKVQNEDTRKGVSKVIHNVRYEKTLMA